MITKEQEKAYEKLQSALTATFKAFEPTTQECAAAYFEVRDAMEEEQTATDYDVISYVFDNRRKNVISSGASCLV